VERDGQQIACEISITSTIDQEVRNVHKCLKANFPSVAVIGLTEDKLRKLENAIKGSLGNDAISRVAFFQPDAFIFHLKGLSRATTKTAEKPDTRRGYKIKRSFTKLSTEESKQREADAIRSIAEAMRRKKA